MSATLLLNGVFAAPKVHIYGGYTPIRNISDLHVQELGEFSMTVYNSQAGRNLKFLKVISDETQVVDGINYRLVILVIEGIIVVPPMKYEAVVYEERDLSSYKPLHV